MKLVVLVVPREVRDDAEAALESVGAFGFTEVPSVYGEGRFPDRPSPDNSRTPNRNTYMRLRNEALFVADRLTPRFTLSPREIFRRDEEDRRRRCRGHRRGGLTKYPAEKIRGAAGVVRGLCGLGSAPGSRPVSRT